MNTKKNPKSEEVTTQKRRGKRETLKKKGERKQREE
jgi:hypothetical protein